MLSAYWAPEKFENELKEELGGTLLRQHGRLFLSSAPARELVWAHTVWRHPELIEIASINDGARKLGRGLWALAPLEENFRRATLITQQVRGLVKQTCLPFLAPRRGALGEFALLEPGLMIASRETSSWVPQGEPLFEESSDAPSRAYLKLWELFTMEGIRPSGRCIDLGASPGGWTWVLASLGCTVDAYDRADLAPHVAAMPGVSLRRGDAFKVKPSEKLDWLFSDLICEPRKLLEYVRAWLESGLCENFVCTIKFKGATDFAVLREFLEIPGSHARHLYHNKHEVTWWRLARDEGARSPRESTSSHK